jgi:hypothetical protein
MFLIKNGDVEAKSLKARIWTEYQVAKVPYFLKNGEYLELKYHLHAIELCMEFYLELLHDLCKPRDTFLGVYIGLQCLLNVKVSCVFSVTKKLFSSSLLLFQTVLKLRIQLALQHLTSVILSVFQIAKLEF